MNLRERIRQHREVLNGHTEYCFDQVNQWKMQLQLEIDREVANYKERVRNNQTAELETLRDSEANINKHIEELKNAERDIQNVASQDSLNEIVTFLQAKGHKFRALLAEHKQILQTIHISKENVPKFEQNRKINILGSLDQKKPPSKTQMIFTAVDWCLNQPYFWVAVLYFFSFGGVGPILILLAKGLSILIPNHLPFRVFKLMMCIFILCVASTMLFISFPYKDVNTRQNDFMFGLSMYLLFFNELKGMVSYLLNIVR